MRHAGANMESVKVQNRASILKYINEMGSVSRKDIADAVHLTPAAVTQICAEMMDQGILIETGEQTISKGAGRRKIPIAINYNYIYVLGITMESEDTLIALTNLRGDLIGKHCLKTQNGTECRPEDFLSVVAEECKTLLAEHPEEGKNVPVATVVISGIVDFESGISKRAYGIWEEEVPVAAIMREKLGIPVYVENNVNAFAMAEILFGVGKEYDDLMVIKWGPGVGGTIIVNRRVYEGSQGKAAEIGHVIVQKNGKRCNCGKIGCLETVVSKYALEETGDFDNAIDIFARTIVNTTTVLAPNRVVLTGKMFRDAEVREKMIAACNQYAGEDIGERIIYTTLSEMEEYIGAVAFLVHRKLR